MRFFRSIYEGVIIAIKAIWQNKLRAILTTFGIVIGIVSVTTMATVIDGIDRSFQSSMQMLGQNVLYVQKWPWSFGPNYKWWDYINRPEIKAEYSEKVQSYSRYVTAVAAITGRNENIKYKDKILNNVQITGATPSYSTTAAVDIEIGRYYTDVEDRLLKNVIIIGSTVAEELFQNEYPLGKQIRIKGRNFEVIGVMVKQGKFLGLQDMDSNVIIPFKTYAKYFGSRRNISLQVKYPNAQVMEEGRYELEGIMRRIRKLDPMDKDDFSINRLELFEQQYKTMTGAIYGVGLFLTALALFVGGIGVMNIMFVSVKERTKEIGIRKAIGAKSKEILFQFLIEAVIVCSIGGVVGVFLSWLASIGINQVFVAYMDWGTVVQAFVICTFVGIIFGFIPAYKAAKADPINSLRYE